MPTKGPPLAATSTRREMSRNVENCREGGPYKWYAGFRQGFKVPPLKLGPPKHLGPPKYFLGAAPPNIFVPLENYKYRKSNS